MKIRRVELVFWVVAASALPAYANNPPQPDGLLSLILIFPVAILGFRLAGASLTDKERKWRAGKGALLAVAVLLAAAGTGIALISLAILLTYGLGRGVRIIKRGQGGKRVAIGIAVMLWTLFAVFDYLVSLNAYPRAAMYESHAVGGLRTLATAEQTFKATPDSSGKASFGTLEQLHQAQLIDDTFLRGRERGAYQYTEIIDPARQQFLFYAVPLTYQKEASTAWSVIPGGSLVTSMRPQKGARRSFAVDETGIIREADLGGSRAVTREQALKWQPLR